MKVRTAIIGGSGVYDPAILSELKMVTVRTPYGEVKIDVGKFKGRTIAFLARHGKGHELPPHKINYRANIAALKIVGVEDIFATAAVGSMNSSFGLGHIVLADSFLDFTKMREMTFYGGGESGVVHTDFTEPYCPGLRRIIEKAAKELNFAVHNGGTYVCTEGPRFESKAEIEFFKMVGGDIVGMTNVPEVILAREAGMCYAVCALVTNYAAGISEQPLTHGEVLDVMRENAEKVKKLLYYSLDSLTEK